MNSKITIPTEDGRYEIDAMAGVIASQLVVAPLDAERYKAISRGLLKRVRQSAADRHGLITLRREGRVYASVDDGVLRHTLRKDAGIRIDLLQMQAGFNLGWPPGVVAQEILVLEGSLREGLINTVTKHELCVRKDPGIAFTSGSDGARLYVRQLVDTDSLPAVERAWWNSDEATQATHWEPLSEGVDLMTLRQVGDVLSALVRIQRDTYVVDHSHTLDEDCMMLQGDIFLGDILLRPDDYQLAQAGCNHVKSMSDTGALFYFHGHMPAAI